MEEITLLYGVLLMALGVVAGIINTLAGGGSNLTIPALMLTGMPADVANATNRVGVFAQTFTGAREFHAKGRLPTHDLKAILAPTLGGSLIGALGASYLPIWLLEPTLLLTMLGMAALMLFKPSVVVADEGTPTRLMKDEKQAWVILFIAGIYGGFVQAGVGFVLIAALAGTLRYDIVATNALKVTCSFFFTGLALVIFIYNDQVSWVPGIILAIGTSIGAWLAVRIAIQIEAKTMKIMLFLMTLAAVVAVLLR